MIVFQIVVAQTIFLKELYINAFSPSFLAHLYEIITKRIHFSTELYNYMFNQLLDTYFVTGN
jgi:hypothetical protein